MISNAVAHDVYAVALRLRHIGLMPSEQNYARYGRWSVMTVKRQSESGTWSGAAVELDLIVELAG